MLRRDLEYLLTWDVETHSWIVQLLTREGDRIVRVGSDATHVAPVLLGAMSGPSGWVE